MRTRVLLIGASGQLGKELQYTLPDDIELIAPSRSQLDIVDVHAIDAICDFRPNAIISAAAYTAVDRAEQEPELAFAVNTDGAGHIATAAHRCTARLVHVSTDFVFSGEQSSPYSEDSETRPLGVYGASKLAGEQQIRAQAPQHGAIIRTAWLYSRHGHNFVKTMLRLMRERESLAVVSDQLGTPTWARGLARAIWTMLKQDMFPGIWHWTDSGQASWYEFAIAIQDEALAIGLLERSVPIKAQRSVEYPTPAARPGFSVLDKTQTLERLQIDGLHWREALHNMLADLADNPEEY